MSRHRERGTSFDGVDRGEVKIILAHGCYNAFAFWKGTEGSTFDDLADMPSGRYIGMRILLNKNATS